MNRDSLYGRKWHSALNAGSFGKTEQLGITFFDQKQPKIKCAEC